MFWIILMNNATSAALNALDKTDTYFVTAHDLFKMVLHLRLSSKPAQS